MKKILPLALSLAFLCQLAHADEGMWLVKDLKGDARDAIVAIDFFGTGSISRILFKIAPPTAAAGTR